MGEIIRYQLSKKILEEIDDKIDIRDIVNDLTEGGVEKVLSAEQGKIIKKELDSIKQYVNNGKTKLETTIIDMGIEVSKENDVVTFDELNYYIISMITDIKNALNYKFNFELTQYSTIQDIIKSINEYVVYKINRKFKIDTTIDISDCTFLFNFNSIYNTKNIITKCEINTVFNSEINMEVII